MCVRVSNDECMLLVPHRESQPADQSKHILSAPTAARPNRQVFFSPIPITLLLKPAKSSSAESKSPLVIDISTDSSNTFSTTNNSHSGAKSRPGNNTQLFLLSSQRLKLLQLRHRREALPTCCKQCSFVHSQKSPLDAFTGCSAPLGFKCVSRIKQTPSLTERSGRRFLTGDLAGLFSK